MNKIINPKALVKCVAILDNYDRQVKAANELIRSVTARMEVMEEFVRANFTGDDVAFNILKEDVLNNRARVERHYRRELVARTRHIVKRAVEYVNANSET